MTTYYATNDNTAATDNFAYLAEATNCARNMSRRADCITASVYTIDIDEDGFQAEYRTTLLRYQDGRIVERDGESV